ncbi:hypothetical protein [Paracoccus sp. ME4]|uniref:hypothetical protein n=1 Tax=Paracoccus sp. ME4 TaxID=3138066 RepID=UPI00398AF747
MATFKHPRTGVELNEITIRRQHLDPDEVTTVLLLSQAGEEQHIIAAMLGINPGRVNTIVKGRNLDDRQEGFL